MQQLPHRLGIGGQTELLPDLFKRPAVLSCRSPACPTQTACRSKANGRAVPGHFTENDSATNKSLSARALPGSARNLRTIQSDIPQRAVVELRQLPNSGAITRPGSKRGDKRCNPHNSLPSVTKKSATWPSRCLVTRECKRFAAKARLSCSNLHGFHSKFES